MIGYCKIVITTRKGLNPTILSYLCSFVSSEDDASSNEPSQNITDSDKNAIEKLLDAVDDSNTEIEDNTGVISDTVDA